MLNKLVGRWLWEENAKEEYRTHGTHVCEYYRKGILVFDCFIPLTVWKKRIVLK